MASLLRNSHRLPTIRITLQPSRSGAQLRFASLLGGESLESRDLPADVVGIQPELTVEAYRGRGFDLPDDVAGAMAGSLQGRAQPGEPIWLQIGASSGHLAVVPWERLLQPALGAPILRIPNFVADPEFVSGRLRLALCASSPRAKTPFDVPSYTRDLITAVQGAVPQGTEIHVFADQAAFHAVHSLADACPPGHIVHVHDPRGAAPFGTGKVDRSLSNASDRLTSPWLLWIQSVLSGNPVDAVHFICPGFFRSDQGALALARSPLVNEDPAWSHFVGSQQLIAFLDLVGAWATAFSPPYESVWAIGLRLLADKLAWRRPGALLIHDTDHGQPGDLAGAYRFLFSIDAEEPQPTPHLMLYSHPRRLARFAQERATFEGVQQAVPSSPEAEAMRGEDEGEEMVADEVPEELTVKADRSASATRGTSEPAWKRTSRLQVDKVLLSLGDRDEAAREGVLEALKRFAGIIEQEGA